MKQNKCITVLIIPNQPEKMHFVWLKTKQFANPSVDWLRDFDEECSEEFVWNSFLATDLHFSSLPVLSQSFFIGRARLEIVYLYE